MQAPLRFLLKTGFLIFALGLLGAGALLAWLGSWRADRTAELDAASEVAQTSAGPMEFLTRGEGPAVLVFHGGAGGYDQAMLFASETAPEGFLLIAPSRPGYLRSPLATGRSFEQQADAAAALLDSLGVESVAVVGVSAGGPAAIQFALRFPQRIWSLVLLSAVTRSFDILTFGDKSTTRLFGNSLADDLGSWVLNEMANRDFPKSLDWVLEFENNLDFKERRALAEEVLAHSGQRDFVRALEETVVPLSNRTAGLFNDVEQIHSLQDLPLEKVSAPTLVVHGTEDRLVPMVNARVAAGRIPGATLLLVENAGHFVQIGSRARETQAAIENFLRKHSGGHPQP